MLGYTIPFREFWKTLRGDTAGGKGVTSLVGFLERRLGGEFVFDTDRLPYDYPEMADLFEIAEKMRAAGVLTSYGPQIMLPDEPGVQVWYAMCNNAKKNTCGGSGPEARSAFVRALAEVNERYLWYERGDFGHPVHAATVQEILRRGNVILPERFAGFSTEQRKTHKQLTITPESRFAWIRGFSWIERKPVWIPAQTVSAYADFVPGHSPGKEPLIRPITTNGLATKPVRDEAVLGGALEIIERDAYIISWLNHLTLPRLDIAALAEEHSHLAKLIGECERMRITPYAVRLVTDAPVYAVCVVLEDKSGEAPRFAIGLKASRSPSEATEGALLEALRARKAVRLYKPAPDEPLWPAERPVQQFGHGDRLRYWADPAHSGQLSFLIQGAVQKRSIEPWERDSDPEYLQRIIEWCRSKKYEFVTVAFTRSRANTTPWHIEAVVIPELHPAHLRENHPCTESPRLRDVPRMFGYEPRGKPYLSVPHPFV